jgi:hypothetical protein
VKGVVTPLK